MTQAIGVIGLCKDIGRLRVLNGFSMRVPTGQLHGLLGSKGSGKSTVIRILMGLQRKDAGHVELLGADPWHEAVELHRRLAYVPSCVQLWPNLSGMEVLDLIGSLRGGLNARRKALLMERFDLDPAKKCCTYSAGDRQKLAIVAAFASDAELLLLDEPSSGLDPLMEVAFHECLREVRAAGKTVLLSSHNLFDVIELCHQVTIVAQGRNLVTATPEELRNLTRMKIVADTSRPLDGLEGLSGVHHVAVDGARVTIEVDPAASDTVSRHLVDHGVRSLASVPSSLEQLLAQDHRSDGTAGKDARHFD